MQNIDINGYVQDLDYRIKDIKKVWWNKLLELYIKH